MERSSTELTGRLAEYTRLAGKVRSMLDGVERVRGTGHSDDDLVTAVVGGRGEVLELELDPRVYRDRDSTRLAANILTAIHNAAERAEVAATAYTESLRAPGGEPDPHVDPVLRLMDEAASTLEDRR